MEVHITNSSASTSIQRRRNENGASPLQGTVNKTNRVSKMSVDVNLQPDRNIGRKKRGSERINLREHVIDTPLPTLISFEDFIKTPQAKQTDTEATDTDATDTEATDGEATDVDEGPEGDETDDEVDEHERLFNTSTYGDTGYPTPVARSTNTVIRSATPPTLGLKAQPPANPKPTLNNKPTTHTDAASDGKSANESEGKIHIQTNPQTRTDTTPSNPPQVVGASVRTDVGQGPKPPSKCAVFTKFLSNSVLNILAIDLIKHAAGVHFPFMGNVASSFAVQLGCYVLQRNSSGTERVSRALTTAGRFSLAVSSVALLAQRKSSIAAKVVNGLVLTTLHGASSAFANLAGRCFARLRARPH